MYWNHFTNYSFSLFEKYWFTNIYTIMEFLLLLNTVFHYLVNINYISLGEIIVYFIGKTHYPI